jgi:hypothetical protein
VRARSRKARSSDKAARLSVEVDVRRVLLHYHIFKNAGTTLEEILAHSFYETFARFDTPESDTLISNADLIRFIQHNPRLQAVSSHQIRYPLPEAAGILFFDVCFLRDPLDRIRSTYDYFREKPVAGNEASDLANRFGIGEFLGCVAAEHPWLIQDAQVNILAGRGVDDPPAGRMELECAIRTMLATAFLGVVDRFEESVIAGAHFLRPVFPRFDAARPPANVSGGMDGTLERRIAKTREACRPEVWEEVMRLNALDFELMDHARAEVLRRFAAAPGGRNE